MIRIAARSGSGESLLLGCRLPTSPCVLTWWKELGSQLGSFFKVTNLIHEGSTPLT